MIVRAWIVVSVAWALPCLWGGCGRDGGLMEKDFILAAFPFIGGLLLWVVGSWIIFGSAMVESQPPPPQAQSGHAAQDMPVPSSDGEASKRGSENRVYDTTSAVPHITPASRGAGRAVRTLPQPGSRTPLPIRTQDSSNREIKGPCTANPPLWNCHRTWWLQSMGSSKKAELTAGKS